MSTQTVVKRTQEEFEAELRRRFGDDPRAWAFMCPMCKDVATVAEFQQALNDAGREGEYASSHVGQICIGRILGALKRGEKYKGRGCDWTAFGLFRGPEFVIMPNGKEVASFPIAPAPEPNDSGTGAQQ